MEKKHPCNVAGHCICEAVVQIAPPCGHSLQNKKGFPSFGRVSNNTNTFAQNPSVASIAHI